jgi:proton-coupled amino acid transporter
VLQLGIIGLIVIAYITDHCCVLIIKCKKAAIDQIMNSTYYCPYDEETTQYHRIEKQKKKQRHNLELAITYGDLGRIAMGVWGSRVVNMALILTQFSFCVNYFIFMGDTITRMFPPVAVEKNNTVTPTPNSTALFQRNHAGKHQGAPSTIYLMLIPFPFFLLQTYVRKIRHLGPLSGIANTCVFLGFFSILGFIIKGAIYIKSNQCIMTEYYYQIILLKPLLISVF